VAQSKGLDDARAYAADVGLVERVAEGSVGAQVEEEDGDEEEELQQDGDRCALGTVSLAP
jgi:hypothetical protein